MFWNYVIGNTRVTKPVMSVEGKCFAKYPLHFTWWELAQYCPFSVMHLVETAKTNPKCSELISDFSPKHIHWIP